MESDEETLMLVIIAFVTHEMTKTHTKQNMKIWTKLWLLTRNQHGFYNYLLAEFRPEE